MSSKPALSPDILRSQEEAFIQHYNWLIRWAMQFSNNDVARAEDLVQEVFVQFAFSQTDLSLVHNIPAYLYTSLRNTHVSEVRIAGRSHLQSLSIVEYSVADAALGASDPHVLYQTHEQLRRVCQYACARKQSSRAGSVLILRFFYGYHISEVAEVLGGTCQAVRQCLRFARNEARLFLDDPSALKFINREQSANTVSSGTARTTEELMAQLRLAIFRSCTGECIVTDTLPRLYKKGVIQTADNSMLAHLVSCPRCLDGANRELGLPLLAARHPADALGPNNNSRGGPGTNGGTGGTRNDLRSRRRLRTSEGEISDTFLLRCRRRARELFEHHPREVCVSVNGHVLGSQTVNSEISRLRLDVTIPEPLSFIEVLSEEATRLLVMTIDAPPNGEPMQAKRVVLSEGRHLEVTLSYGHPWPMLEVVYHDPNFIAESQLSLSDVSVTWGSSPAEYSSFLPVVVEAGASLDHLRSSFLAGASRRAPLSGRTLASLGHYGFGRPWRLIVSTLRRKHVAPSTGRQRHEIFYLSPATRLVRKSFWSSPGFITAILSLFLIGALLFVRLNITPTVTAANLIERATAAEAALTEGTDRATHRVVNLEERARAGGDLITRKRIEIWRDAGKGLSVRRVYDEKGQLIAGEWSRRHPTEGDNVTRTIYRREQALRTESSAGNPRVAISNMELWQLEPSAKDYGGMIAHPDAASVSENPAAYVLSYAGPDATGDGTLSQATLILRKSDLHAVEQILTVKRGGETREYRFVEAAFERPRVDGVTPTIFEVDPGLLPERIAAEGGRMRRAGDTLDSSSFIPQSSAVATAELEIEVAYLLDQFRTRFGDQITLTRTPDDFLEVQGIVGNEESKKEILNALAPVVNHPAVRVQINTTTELLERQQRLPDRVILREFAGSESGIPVYRELRGYFSRQPLEDSRVDEAVRAFAARVVSGSRRALSHAIELKQLSERFSATQLDGLTPAARARLFSMVRGHAEQLGREAAKLRGELQPIFPTENDGANEAGEISNDAGLAPAIERLYKLVLENDEQIRSAFAASSDVPTSQVTKAPRLRLSLSKAESLAGRIEQVAAKG
jgi:RNA polymerase sigma factor (sigma-70 family)